MSTTSCFLPWVGEFGWYVMTHVRKVFADPSKSKLVCCLPGHECLFPNAQRFEYGWQEDQRDEQKRWGGDLGPEARELLMKRILAERGPVEFISASFDRRLTAWKQVFFVPPVANPLGLRVDVVLAPRYRRRATYNNWPHWPDLAARLSAAGFSIGVVGSQGQSVPLEQSRLNSWDYGAIAPIVEMMRNAKLVVSSDSGMAHLGVLCQVPLLVFGHRGTPGIHWMKSQRNRSIPFKAMIGRDVWDDPARVAAEAIALIADKSAPMAHG